MGAGSIEVKDAQGDLNLKLKPEESAHSKVTPKAERGGIAKALKQTPQVTEVAGSSSVGASSSGLHPNPRLDAEEVKVLTNSAVKVARCKLCGQLVSRSMEAIEQHSDQCQPALPHGLQRVLDATWQPARPIQVFSPPHVSASLPDSSKPFQPNLHSRQIANEHTRMQPWACEAGRQQP